MKNTKAQACSHCGEMVAPGQGDLTKTERYDGGTSWSVRHTAECEPGQARSARPDSSEVPRWAIRGEGYTTHGNWTVGVRLVDGAEPEIKGWDAPVPVNDAAKAIVKRRENPSAREAARDAGDFDAGNETGGEA